jgi:[CysO sulfur-carrier protein]-S-L-cysteine hydrolase
MKISRELLDQLAAHVLEDPSNEICGVVAVAADGAAAGERRAVQAYRARNMHLSPLRFEIDPKYAGNWPGVEWIIVGLASGTPEVRSYLIEEGQVREVPLEVQ